MRASLAPQRRTDLEPDCEALVLQLGAARPIYVAVCYRPPGADGDVTKLAELVRRLRLTNRPLLIAGDFNLPEIQWLADGRPVLLKRTAPAVTFLDCLAECDVTQSVTAPTRGSATLDLVLSCGGPETSEVLSESESVFDSDHLAVTSRLAVDVRASPRATRTKAYNYKRADFDSLRAALRLVPRAMLSDCSVDDAVSMFYDFVFAAVADHVPLVELRNKYPPWFDRAVRALLRDKGIAHRQKRRYPTPDNVARNAALRSEFKRLVTVKYRDYLVSLVRKYRDYLVSLVRNSRTIPNAIGRLFGP